MKKSTSKKYPETEIEPCARFRAVWSVGRMQKTAACQWQKEQLLEARRKWEARRRSWCLNTLEGRKRAVLSNVRTHVEASVPFMEPIPKRAQLMETTILNVESCSTIASAPPPLSLPPHPTSSATYPRPWAEFVRQVKNPAPIVQPHKPQKRRQSDSMEWKRIIEDRTELRAGTGWKSCFYC